VEDLIVVEDVSPWCIIGFDSEERTPIQRISMLQELGLNKYGFNRGKGDISKMIEEFELASKNDIEITSIFLWLNAKRDSVGKLSEGNQELLRNLSKVEQKPTVWVSLSSNFFKDKSQTESVALSVEMIKYVKSQIQDLGCDLAIYNHHGWFGDPHNQLEIVKELADPSITMVYNFHHAQEHVDDFPEIAKRIAPHLSYVNVNGVKKEGPQIVTVGEGDYEYEMIKTLKNNGFDGPWGILGHIKTEDVREVLVRNMEGLKEFNSSYLNQ